MKHLRTIQNLRSVIWLLLVALIPLSLYGLHWANRTGLPEEWREAIQSQISKQGFHVELGSLQYIPLQGFIATNVAVFAEEDKQNQLSNFERIQLVLDYASLASGEVRLRKIQLKNADVSLPINPDNPLGKTITFSGVYGTVLMPSSRLLEVKDARGKVDGIDIILNARLYGQAPKMRRPDEDRNNSRRREMIANILDQLKGWDFNGETPPKVVINLEGQLSDKTTLKADFEISIPSISRKQHSLKNVKSTGRIDGNILTLNSIYTEDSRGQLKASAEYQIFKKIGRFSVDSSMDLPRLITSWTESSLNLDLLTGGEQKLNFEGLIDLSKKGKPKLNGIGKIHCESVMYRGVSFDSMKTWFSWQDGALFLKNLNLRHGQKNALGKVMYQDGITRIKLDTNLPLALYKPMFAGAPLEKVLGDFTPNKGASNKVSLNLKLNKNEPLNWQFDGTALVKNMSYRGVPVNSARCDITLDKNMFSFTNGQINFDYTDYKMRKDFSGPSSAIANVTGIHFDRKAKILKFEEARGNFWAAPLLRCFIPNIADHVEDYRFHRPPTLQGNGSIDFTKKGKADITVKFTSSDPVTYKFLGKNMSFSKASGTVKVLGHDVIVSNLQTRLFEGELAGNLKRSSNSNLSGEFHWSDIGFAQIASNYGFEDNGGGELTGRIDFSMNNNGTSSLNANGLIALKDGALFSVPIFGPLSRVASKVVDDKRAGFERAKAAFCTFNIKHGILYTNDFQTSTTSLRFTGDGNVDLNEKEIDFTIRLNARGLLGIITLPLRPFTGLFQFRGTGPIRNPAWERSSFTRPPDAQDEILLATPPKARAVR